MKNVKLSFRSGKNRQTKRDLETKEARKARKKKENERFVQLKNDAKTQLDSALNRFYAPTKRTLNETMRTATDFLNSLELND